MTIALRQADAADLSALLRMAARFADEAGHGLPFDAAHATASFARAMMSDDALVMVLDVAGHPRGMLAAVVTDSALAPVRVASELAWWIDPGARSLEAANAMLDGYEAWARARGCAVCGMALLGDQRGGAVYARRGYAPAEPHRRKVL